MGILTNQSGTLVFPTPLATNLKDLLDANRSAERMLRTIVNKEALLLSKMADVLDLLLPPSE